MNGSIPRPKVLEPGRATRAWRTLLQLAQLQITKKIEGFIVSWNMEEIQGITFFRRRMKKSRTGHPTTHTISTHASSTVSKSPEFSGFKGHFSRKHSECTV